MISTILVVDSDPVARSTLAGDLRAFGHVVAVDDGRHATELMSAFHFDVVLLATHTEDLDWRDFLARTRSLRDGPEVILMSHVSSVDSTIEALRLRACDIVGEPPTGTELRRAVDTALTRHTGGAASRSPGSR